MLPFVFFGSAFQYVRFYAGNKKFRTYFLNGIFADNAFWQNKTRQFVTVGLALLICSNDFASFYKFHFFASYSLVYRIFALTVNDLGWRR